VGYITHKVLDMRKPSDKWFLNVSMLRIFNVDFLEKGATITTKYYSGLLDILKQ
jgi:hypothetical protein